jgi:hypothetical protein
VKGRAPFLVFRRTITQAISTQQLVPVHAHIKIHLL